ncbi:MAG: diphosphomevalonate decarboxylase [Crocinitomicaceae bacterium]
MQTTTAEQVVLKSIWRCPSNIAIVKYWGKYGNQLPCNSSLSLTLSNSFTEIELELLKKNSNEAVELEYFFEGTKNEQFASRVSKYLIDNVAYFPFLNDYALRINSKNSFPHSAGIASSASAFGAIALAMYDAFYTLNDKQLDAEFYHTTSHLARLGSGSASRSMFAGYAMWGENTAIKNSSNEFAIPVQEIHANFQQMHDAILIVEDEPKKVSSSVGHSLMNNHPYAQNRFAQANERTARLVEILKTGDYQEFIQMCESEALTLHAMMMTSNDYYLLMKPGTLLAIEKLMNFRKETNIPVCFTLDAGPNVHVLYPNSVKDKVEQFIHNELKSTYKSVIFDELGTGPTCLSR